jgi:hypothetical protein
MKKIILLLIAFVCLVKVSAQQIEHAPQMATSSIYNKDAKFLLFPTKNMYIFLKLDTSSGELWMVQYSTTGTQMEVKFPSLFYPLVSSTEQSNGRFFLYPTQNMYNFLLIDQIDGRVWQAQWSTELENVGLLRIK